MLRNIHYTIFLWYFPIGSDGKESACNVGDLGSVPGLERSPGEGNGNTLQNCCLENSMDREAWWGSMASMRSQRVGHDWLTLRFHCIIKLSRTWCWCWCCIHTHRSFSISSITFPHFFNITVDIFDTIHISTIWSIVLMVEWFVFQTWEISTIFSPNSNSIIFTFLSIVISWHFLAAPATYLQLPHILGLK